MKGFLTRNIKTLLIDKKVVGIDRFIKVGQGGWFSAMRL